MARRVDEQPPAMDNFTQARYTYLKRSNCEDRRPTDQTWYGEYLYLGMWLYTDLCLVAQDVVSSQTSGQVLKDYQHVWMYVNRNGFLHNVLTGSPLM